MPHAQYRSTTVRIQKFKFLLKAKMRGMLGLTRHGKTGGARAAMEDGDGGWEYIVGYRRIGVRCRWFNKRHPKTTIPKHPLCSWKVVGSRGIDRRATCEGMCPDLCRL